MTYNAKDENLNVRISTFHEGLHWLYTDGFGNELSVICHDFSYGGKCGMFEIMPSWKKPCKNDSVKGFLTFGEVQKWIDKLKKLNKS